MEVSFVLRREGGFDDLRVDGAYKPLVNAARDAVNKAKPLPVPPADVTCPLRVNFRMRFALQ